MNLKKLSLMLAVAVFAVAGTVNADEVLVSSNISTSTAWTSDNVYNLQDQVFVEPGATLTIEAGTLVQSTSGGGGSLAVARGGKIYANGTKDNPIIMTSTDDDLNSWHEGCNEWGNLTLMGNALISASHYGGNPVGSNTKTPTGDNEKLMEGLTDNTYGMYGGNDDNDNSGSLSYVSIRYGGKVIGLANELNGLSLGGIGRETDISHIEIMNNVDDGIEIWGGTVCLKYVNIWNIGDDSFDIDQGWRGKAQFGLIVQGHSIDASQGSGVGDNCFETDGAEDSDAQPVTTASIYNFTVVGNPGDGDGGTTWRDNARMQYRNCIFMDLGEKLVRFDGDDGDGANGYGYNGTLSWADTWTTSYDHSTTTAMPNAGSWSAGDFNDPSVMYTAQVDGNLAEISDSVFFRNMHADAYTEADARGVRDGSNDNVTAAFDAGNPDANMPIQQLVRGAKVVKGGKDVYPVEFINPCAANDAVTSAGTAPDDGFFTPAQYRGGFPSDYNWLEGWTAVDAYGMTDTSMNGDEILVDSNIKTSTTWTSDKVYNLQKQVFVEPGATLTIEPGTLVQSTSGLGGSLAVSRGAKIYVNGTEDAPVIMTSTDDDLKTYREGCNEWGNLTLMGNALISASHYGGNPVGSNTKTPTGDNEKLMEGLTDNTYGMYGGNDDNDNSGSISYLSLRYGGKVIGLANELNGLSLGGIGRETDISHVEVINNVDDGIEIWGGTVCLKYVNIWNIGDDSFDIDQGWRGKAQFGLIVQGHSIDASQGSGVGDNCFETDGAEDSDAQPVTTASIYNFTVVGNPGDGDGGTTWRDNARMQYSNCIFMDLGEKLVRFDGDDGDGANGYGYNGTLSWEDTWTTSYDYSTTTAMPNAGSWSAGDFNDPSVMYTAQVDGNLAEISDSVFFRNMHADAYTEADARGVRDGSNDNVTAAFDAGNPDANMPIQQLVRGGKVVKGGKDVYPVEFINPCAANDAVTSVGAAPADGFFVPAQFRGAFSEDNNWLANWSAIDQYGMTDTSMNQPSGDINNDGIVDVEDLSAIGAGWLQVK
ncbi:hypothetical protein [Sedimentisphaera salicampi]|uniref:hypothetical protein n=1 Tax=Sedimentisphaera salicampi TaxID=1941349 RepID=UPI000B9B7DEA|nr:hypothetical protein [Sedimentisphaera salicampi]OXU14676.1 hypothetical protein SMSP1_01556 [Sedimentisphaera salicampi]